MTSAVTTRRNLWSKIWRNYELYLFLLPTIVYFAIFQYGPMYGIQIAFKRYTSSKGIFGSDWVGFDHFERFFNSLQFWNIVTNTLEISLYQLCVAFPIPIVFALLLNQLTSARFKKFVQTVTYAPHFISLVIIVGMLYLYLSPRNGMINNLLGIFGIEPIFFLGEAAWFKTIFVFSGVWQNAGWSAIIYLAALTAINPELHEAAVIDGANKMRRIWHVDIPGIMPTIMILLILDVGSFLSVGFDKAFLLQNPLNIESSEIIATYVYKVGLQQTQYSYSAAIGLFNNVINLILLLSVNQIAKKMKQTSLW